MDRAHVEQQDETNEDKEGEHHAHPQQDDLPPALVHPERDEGQDGVANEEAEYEPEEVCVVVNPGQETEQKEDSRHPHQLQYRHLRVLQARPLVDDLNDAGGEEAEVGPGGPDLSPVGHEDGGGEVPDHAGAEVDQPHPTSADQLLKVPEIQRLELRAGKK